MIGSTQGDDVAEAKKRLTDIDPNCDPLTTGELLQMIGKVESAQETIKNAQKNVGEVATVAGLHKEFEILKQRLELCYAKLDRMTGLYGTLQGQYEQLHRLWVASLNLKVNHGPTDGTDDQSGD